MFEELAEAYVNSKADGGHFDLEQFGKAYFSESSMKQAFIAGLEAGRLKWHKVADGDLPPENTEVLNDDGVKVILIHGHWRYFYGDAWEDDAYVHHWCKVPQYTEEG